MEVKGQFHLPIAPYPGTNPGTRSIVCWLSPTAFPHGEEKNLSPVPEFETRGV
jgi:hypothetical protein